ncbi:hypothetical protein MJA45_08710 [Paenibacillus aurantius]|uniref:Glycoside hydrolase 123 catalytic domain-containing protein n=1 Tax=Paenibacillus aurantius TaxID=2918900 RepID=A0AA96LFK2_9BACL|nr:glycoside hydrolase domain-containing protein [Paenibacillus aurantius]WNQ13089.1 hypothetical protein MJA45_08710 [Paenibacillus aurantius]
MDSEPKFESRCIPSLAKVFSDEELREEAYRQGSALIGEYFSFQVAYRLSAHLKMSISVDSELAGNISIRRVGLAPSELPNYSDHDDFLLRTTPGLYPDPLYPLENESVKLPANQWRSLWITVHLTEKVTPGMHDIHVRFKDESGSQLGAEAFRLEAIGVKLPEQKLIHTEWFYLDCLATLYNVEVFSEAHWTIIESYLSNYVEYGMNMILTPLFTPPLEMLPGNERPTVQLIGVQQDGSRYAFDFSRLDRWIELCRRKGLRYFEFSHLFTQWGAKHAPKIIATVNGEEKRVFGWETDAAGEDYRCFLTQFIPELIQRIRTHELENCSFFHLSDEPGLNDLPSYTQASKLVRSLLGNFPIIDALSEYDFYSTGLLSHPVVATGHIGRFIDNKTPNLWAYYCCNEYRDHLSNRFFNMPSSRTRMIGVQMYKYDIQGFLHWGYNHWYSQKSLREIDPYLVNGCPIPGLRRCTSATYVRSFGNRFKTGT